MMPRGDVRVEHSVPDRFARAVAQPAQGDRPLPSGRVAGLVNEFLDLDIATRELLARGVLSLRSTARWLRESQGWDDIGEEAIVSALRRYPAEERTASVRAARRVLQASHVNTRANIACLVVPKTEESQSSRRLIASQFELARGELFRVIESERVITIIMERAKLETVQAILAERDIRAAVKALVEHSIVMPLEAAKTPGILALIFSSLAAYNINVIESAGGTTDHLVFVEEKDAKRALQILTRLTRRT